MLSSDKSNTNLKRYNQTMKRYFSLFLLSFVLMGASCSAQQESTEEGVQNPPPAELVELRPQVLNSYPHDSDAFTQGLLLHNDLFYESTGLRGRSSLRKVTVETGEVVEQISVPQALFCRRLGAGGR